MGRTFSYLFVVICAIFYKRCPQTVAQQCKTPFKSEAYDILKTLGFSASCTTAALELCDKQCNHDFYQLFSSLKDAVDSFQTSFQSVKNELEAISSCIVPRGQIGWTPGQAGKLRKHQNCHEIKQSGDNESGIRTIYPYECCPDKEVQIYCEQTVDGGGWTVIQRRAPLPIREDFYRIWSEYAKGFGNLTGEFWLGLNTIHALTSSSASELRIDMEDTKNEKRFAKYKTFHVADEDEKYRLTVDDYSGTAGDSLIAKHNGQCFTTFERDNDNHKDNCAKLYKGAWWFNTCFDSSLNGQPLLGKITGHMGIHWRSFQGVSYSLPDVTIMIRPRIST